jgi:uncharacterized protein YukE
MNDIVNCTDKYAVELRNTYDGITILNDKIKTLNPENIRKKFDVYWNIVNSKSEEINDALEDIDEAINNLEDSKELVVKIKDVNDKVKQTMNSFRVGTLQGISRQTVRENNIVPNENDEIGVNAVNQLEPYNELEDINRTNNIGGRKSRKSRKRGKGRKGRKSRK